MSKAAEIRDQKSQIGDSSSFLRPPAVSSSLLGASNLKVALLTGGGDRPYALGMAAALTWHGIHLDFIGSDDLISPELLVNPRIAFLNLRGAQGSDASAIAKTRRVLSYYVRLVRYASTAQPKLFHILWNNKFQVLDRTLLMLYYRLIGKRIAFTAHNVNAGKRDSNDTFLNRISLRIQYGLSDHIFVHTEKMKGELASDFSVRSDKVSVIPFGINETVPNTSLSTAEAKHQVGVRSSDKTLLFFGNIAPYKGLEYLVRAFTELLKTDPSYRLMIVGRPKKSEGYWNKIDQTIARTGIGDRIIKNITYVPDEATELYFKSADVLVLPYSRVFQSGVLFLGYSFGLPAIVADIGSLREEIVEGKTGFVFRARDADDLARTIRQYFASDLFASLESRRSEIGEYARHRYSWDKVAEITTAAYLKVLRRTGSEVADQRLGTPVRERDELRFDA
jgi:glycosyltransferase involved in cell wall biosynthesis